MPALITLILLALTLIAVIALHLFAPLRRSSWAAAAIGSLAAWGSVFFWQISLPALLPVGSWRPVSLFAVSPALKVDALAWVYALSLTSLAAAVIFTSSAQTETSVWAWAGSLTLTALGLLAFLSDNPLTLVMIWTALDLTDALNTLRSASDGAMSEKAVMSFSVRAAGTGFALWASVNNAMLGAPFLFENLRPQSAVYLLIAVGLRVGVLPLHLAAEPQMRRGFGSALRLTAAASSLALLSRLPQVGLTETSLLILQAGALLAALYGSWKWFSGQEDVLSLRPFWLIAVSALALLQAAGGNGAGAAAWGCVLVLTGGGVFLAFARQRWLQVLLSLLVLFSLGLPFSLTGTVWLADLPWFLALPALLAQAMLLAGVFFFLWRSSGPAWEELPQWARVSYPLGLSLLPLTALILGLWGWPGALRLGNWPVGLAALALTTGLLTLRWRFWPQSAPGQSAPRQSRLYQIQARLTAAVGWLYRFIRRASFFLVGLLEGEGGLLWILLTLVIFALVFKA